MNPHTGTKDEVLDLMARRSKGKLTKEDLLALFATLRQPSLKAAAKSVGRSRQTCTEMADKASTVLFQTRNKYIGSHFASEKFGNYPVELYGRSSIGQVDTVPISVPAGTGYYQPKYEDHVVKFLVAVTNHGYIFSVDGPYMGSSHDGVIADHSEFFTRCAEEFPESTILADGIFSEKFAPNVLIPPRRAACAKNPDDAQKAKDISHYRSRIEHVFGSGTGLQRFSKLMTDRWRRDLGALQRFFVSACCYRNAELVLSHGLDGMYKRPSQNDQNELELEEAPVQEQRERKRARVEESFTRNPMVPNPPEVMAAEPRPKPEETPALRPYVNRDGCLAGTYALYNFGIRTCWHFRWLLENFSDEEIIQEVNRCQQVEGGISVRWILLCGRAEYNVQAPKKSKKLRKFIEGSLPWTLGAGQ